MILDELPKVGTGKIDKQGLRACAPVTVTDE